MNSWIIPASGLSPETDLIINYPLDNNLCISGFIGTGKTTALLYLIRRLKSTQNTQRVIFLVYNYLIRDEFKGLGLNIEIETYWKFKAKLSHYDYIICDDIQVIDANMLRNIKNYTNHIIVAFNPYLTIFEKSPLSQEQPLTLEQIQDILQPKRYELTISYVNSSILKIAKSLIGNDNAFHLNQDLSHMDSIIRICEAENINQEINYIHKQTSKFLSRGNHIVILIPTNRSILSFIQNLIKLEGKPKWEEKTDTWGRLDFPDLNKHLSSIGLKYQCLGSTYGDFSEIGNKTSIMTYHACMGISFDYVFMPFMNNKLFISHNETISKNLFVMAITRARWNVFLTYNGRMHPILYQIMDKCSIIEV